VPRIRRCPPSPSLASPLLQHNLPAALGLQCATPAAGGDPLAPQPSPRTVLGSNNPCPSDADASAPCAAWSAKRFKENDSSQRRERDPELGKHPGGQALSGNGKERGAPGPWRHSALTPQRFALPELPTAAACRGRDGTALQERSTALPGAADAALPRHASSLRSPSRSRSRHRGSGTLRVREQPPAPAPTGQGSEGPGPPAAARSSAGFSAASPLRDGCFTPKAERGEAQQQQPEASRTQRVWRRRPDDR